MHCVMHSGVTLIEKRSLTQLWRGCRQLGRLPEALKAQQSHCTLAGKTIFVFFLHFPSVLKVHTQHPRIHYISQRRSLKRTLVDTGICLYVLLLWVLIKWHNLSKHCSAGAALPITVVQVFPIMLIESMETSTQPVIGAMVSWHWCVVIGALAKVPITTYNLPQCWQPEKYHQDEMNRGRGRCRSPLWQGCPPIDTRNEQYSKRQHP